MERTVSIKLGLDHDQQFAELADVFVQAMNWICDRAWTLEQFFYPALRPLVYNEVRDRFGLKANHACAAIRQVCQALVSGRTRARRKKHPQTKPRFTRPTVGYDIRTSKITADHLSLATLEGRIHIDINLSDYQRQFFDGTWKIGGSKLVKRADGDWYLNVFVSKDTPPVRSEGRTIGVDQGIRHIAVTSDGQFINAGELNRRTAQFRRNRGRLESKGTPSSRKRLKSLARRENRFRDDVLHRAVKSILSSCNDVKAIVLEDLKQIEKRGGPTLNRRVSNWGFAKFRSIIESKAQEIGVAVEVVDARYTSQKCSRCGGVEKLNRDPSRHLYSCSCGLHLNDDLNAARNIRANYLRAIGEGDGAQSTAPDVTPSGCDEPTTSVVGG